MRADRIVRRKSGGFDCIWMCHRTSPDLEKLRQSTIVLRGGLVLIACEPYD
jgi:hypothetical protein